MLTFRLLEKTITGQINGKPFNLPRTKDVQKELKKLQKVKNLTTEEFTEFIHSTHKTVVAGKCKYIMYNPTSQEYFLTLEDKVYPDALPPAMVKVMEDSSEKGIDYLPIVKAFVRFITGARYEKKNLALLDAYLTATFTDKVEIANLQKEFGYSYEVAENLATYQDITITQEGLLATYKVAEMVTWEHVMELDTETGEYVKKIQDRYKKIPAVICPVSGEELEAQKYEFPDNKEEILFTPAIEKHGDRFFSGDKLGYIYEIGKTQRLPLNANRNLANTFGGGGLYIGGLAYIDTYLSSSRLALTCFVNPGDILSFQSEGKAIRTDALFVTDVLDFDARLLGTYHSSTYATLSEERLEELISSALGMDLVDYSEKVSAAEGIDVSKEEFLEDLPEVIEVDIPAATGSDLDLDHSW